MWPMASTKPTQAISTLFVAVLLLNSRHASASALSRASARALAAANSVVQAPAPAGTLFEPSSAAYARRAQSIKTNLKLNQTFFANISATPTPAIQKIANGTFVIKPVVEAGGSKIESANTDGEPV